MKGNNKITVTNIIREIGVPANIKGYYYLREAIVRAADDTGIINSLTKELYPTIAKMYKTTSSRVERDMRYAIALVWKKGNLELLEYYFGYTINNEREKPANGKFIATICDAINLSESK